MNTDVSELIQAVFDRMTAHDHAGMVALFTEDAELYDPHYPIPTMVGRAAISRGLAWSMETLVEPGFVVKGLWTEGGCGAVEIETHHVLKGGMKLDFEQVFLFEIRDEKIHRLRAFVPYRAPGIGGWIARMTGFFWRLRGHGPPP